jgi:hypothetical protein
MLDGSALRFSHASCLLRRRSGHPFGRMSFRPRAAGRPGAAGPIRPTDHPPNRGAHPSADQPAHRVGGSGFRTGYKPTGCPPTLPTSAACSRSLLRNQAFKPTRWCRDLPPSWKPGWKAIARNWARWQAGFQTPARRPGAGRSAHLRAAAGHRPDGAGCGPRVSRSGGVLRG